MRGHGGNTANNHNSNSLPSRLTEAVRVGWSPATKRR